MASAFKSFVFLTVVALMSVFVAWGYLRSKGELAAIHQPLLNHPFLKHEIQYQNETKHHFDLVAYHALNSAELSGTVSERFRQLSAKAPELVFWLDISPATEGQFVVEEPTFSPQPLGEILEAINGNRLILNFLHYQPGMLEQIASALKQNVADRSLIQSREDGLLKDLREAQPSWLFGSSQAQVTRVTMLAAVGLEASAKLKGDVFVVENEVPERHILARLTDRMIAEIHRRKMKIYAGPVRKDEIDTLVQRGVDGVLTSDVKDYLKASTVAVAPEGRTH